MNYRKKISCLLAALEASAVLLSVSGCAPETGPGICYRIQGGNSDMVILGSIHVGNRDLQAFGPHIRQAIDQADAFVFECDTTSADARQTVMQYQQGDSPLREKLSPETYALVEKAAKAAGIDMDSLNRLHPWAVSSLFTSVQAAQDLETGSLGRAQSMGIEDAVWDKLNGREVRYLETPVQQLEILRGFSPELQDAMVRSGCELVLGLEKSDVSLWPDWWQQGETERFAEAYGQNDDFPSPEVQTEYQNALLTGRNQRMAQGLADMLSEEGRSFFVTVGLYHLVLPNDSVLALLEEAGFTVERLIP